MKFCVCAYPETSEELLRRTGPEIQIELQSFGLKGVRSPEAWRFRAEFYERLARANGDRAFNIHGPFLDLSWFSWDHLIAEVSEKRVADTVSLCESIEPERLVMHLNCPAYFCREPHIGKWVEPAAEFWRPWLERLSGTGTRVVFENVQEPDPASAAAFVEALSEFHVGFCLDVGHANAFTPLPPVEWVRGLGSRIAHFHIHDNSGDDDSHLAPGRGSIDFEALLAEIGRLCPDSVLSMEVETGVEETLAALDFVRKGLED